MPELPEVETIVRDLDRNTRGLTIKNFKVLNEKTRRARPFLNVNEKKFRQKISGRKINEVRRRAKILVFDLGDIYLLAHLKMTGQLILRLPQGRLVTGGHPITGAGFELPNKFTRAIIFFSDGSQLYFNDIRRFGWLKLLNKQALAAEFSAHGLEPLEKIFTAASLVAILKRKAKSTVKQAIMDQKQLVGVGNIYADESLFAAKIKPQRLAGTINAAEIARLHRVIIKILKLAITKRGTSFSDYRDGHGRAGGFVKYLQVYGRAGKPCALCGRPIKKGRIGGRGTHWCGYCQK